MIKAICFDLDGVYFTNRGKASFQKALTEELQVDEEKVKYIMQKSPEMAKLVRGQISNSDFWEWFRNETGVSKSDEELTEMWVRNYEVDENVKKFVLELKSKGYKTCVCTNNNGIRLPVLVERFGLNDIFDVITSSHEVGECKPDTKIFQSLLDKLSVKGEELVYSDDNPERLSGARELGIRTSVFENFEQFKNEVSAVLRNENRISENRFFS